VRESDGPGARERYHDRFTLSAREKAYMIRTAAYRCSVPSGMLEKDCVGSEHRGHGRFTPRV